MTATLLAVQRCRSVLQRSRYQSPTTRPFEELEESIRETIEHEIQLGTDELPVVCCFLSDNTWTLVTSKRLVWVNDGPAGAVGWQDVRYCDPEDADKLIARPQSKRDRQRLVITSSSGQKFEIALDPRTFPPLWKIIEIMVRTAARSK
jgi:hypothetical protein